MDLIVNSIGVEVRLKQRVSIAPASATLRDVLPALKGLGMEELQRFVGDDLAPIDGSVILVNGRNMLSLSGWETGIGDGDEITFMVPVAGG